jgi:large subunit ribosomal protein L16
MSLYKKPKQIKYKKCKKGRLKKLEFKVTSLKFGTFGLKAAESGVIKSNQLLAAKQAIIKKVKKKGKI